MSRRVLPDSFAAVELSRQRVAVLLLAVVVLTAGCSGFVGGDSDAADDSAPLDSIPEQATSVSHMQTAVLTDSVTESLVDELSTAETTVDDEFEDPQSWDAMLSEVENETGVAVEDVHSMTMFAGAQSGEMADDYSGVIVKSDLSWDEIRSAAEEAEAVSEDEADFEDLQEESYNGVTVYSSETDDVETTSWIADFGDGTFAVGTQNVVKDVIDTRQGDAPGINDELRSTFEGVTDGYIKSAATLTDEQANMVGDIAAGQGGLGGMLVPELKAVTSSYHTKNDEMNMEVDMVLNSSEKAESFTKLADTYTSKQSGVEDPTPKEQPTAWLINTISVESNDNRVSIAFRSGPEELTTAVEAFDESRLFEGLFTGTGASIQSTSVTANATA
ncbi:hypothetical protein ACFQJ7_02145 [Halovenus rubra]|uniref:Uncharacterized protein n=2 Tax=Halovenus rubra TaxID=869890 RepID=A0ABD5X4B1_9EURY|nr:hypothetical protein [Halovenus rubra]